MDNLKLYAKITKVDPETRIVEGYASTEAQDSQGEIVSKVAIANALPNYMKFGNIREMHQPKAAGKTKSATVDDKGLYIQAKIVSNDAWELVKEGVYQGFSIGGSVVTKIKNRITALELNEISLVDRPANPEAMFTMVKMVDGNTLDFNNNEMEKAKKKEEVVEEVEEVVETPEVVKETVEVVEEAPEEVVVDEVKEASSEVTDLVKRLDAIESKLDQIIAKTDSAEVEKVDGVEDRLAKLEEQVKQPVKAKAAYVVEKVDSNDDSRKADEDRLEEIKAEIEKYRVNGTRPPVGLTEEGFELINKLKN